MKRHNSAIITVALLAAGVAGFTVSGALAQAPAPRTLAPPTVTYADLADLADSAPLALRAQVRRMTMVEPERAPGVRPGWGRFYVVAKTRALIAGNAVLGGDLRYLADLPLDQRDKPPALKGKEVLLFARANPARPGELQLVAPDAQIPWDAASEARLRAILTELQNPAAPARVSGIREAIHVPGTLAGEGETQMFLATRSDTATSVTVIHQPGRPPRWGVAFSEVFDDSARPPPRETLAWYRLACFLPPQLPRSANLSATPADQAAAEADYRLVLRELGECTRNRR